MSATSDFVAVVVQVMNALQEQKHAALPQNYAEKFYSAIITFRHHLVFDPRDKVRFRRLIPPCHYALMK